MLECPFYKPVRDKFSSLIRDVKYHLSVCGQTKQQRNNHNFECLYSMFVNHHIELCDFAI